MAYIVLITGSRYWSYQDADLIYQRLDQEDAIDVLVSGMAPGVDLICYDWSTLRGVHCDKYPADWDNPAYRTKTGKSFAGNARNQQMLDDTLKKYGKYPDKCIAFHEDFENSRGTKDMVRRARKVGVPIEFYTE